MKPLGIGRRFEFEVGDRRVSVAVAEHTPSIKFSLRTSDPTEVKAREAEAAKQAELHWKVLRQTEPVTLTHRQCVALAGRAYGGWTAEPRRETTTAMVRVPIGKVKPGEAPKQWARMPMATHGWDA